jgi:hypothetical protein
MANTREGNVIFVDTDDSTFSGPLYIESVKYIGNTSGTANIKDTNDSGDVFWEESGANNTYNQGLNIRAVGGIFVNVTNSAKVYIYLKS